MFKRNALIFASALSIMIAWGVCCPLVAAEAELQKYSRTERQMGVDFEIVLYASSPSAGEQALAAGFARIAELNRKLSDYDMDSELSQLSAASPTASLVPVSNDLWRVLVVSQQIEKASDGAFDITIGPLSKLWRSARRRKEAPTADQIAKARESVDAAALVLHRCQYRDEKTGQPVSHAASLTKPHMRLDLGGIAKGFAADEALRAMAELGVKRALVRGSGDIAAGDPPPGEEAWKVGIAPLSPEEPPTRFIGIVNQAVSTSGDSRQHLIVDGVRHSHIINPKTGWGVTGRSSVTVIAPKGIYADSLASAVSVLGPKKGLELIQSREQTFALIIWEDGKDGEFGEEVSEGFAKFFTQTPHLKN